MSDAPLTADEIARFLMPDRAVLHVKYEHWRTLASAYLALQSTLAAAEAERDRALAKARVKQAAADRWRLHHDRQVGKKRSLSVRYKYALQRAVELEAALQNALQAGR